MIKTLLLDTFLLMGIIWMLISIVYFCIRLDRLLSSMEKPVVETREETAEVVLSEEDTSSPSVHSTSYIENILREHLREHQNLINDAADKQRSKTTVTL